jgi:cytochrome c5
MVVAASAQQKEASVDHAKLIQGWDQQTLKQGKQVYQRVCFACHGKDGAAANNPQARSFLKGELKNGADPHSMYRSITDGYKKMPGQGWLKPEQRYAVIHYVREAFLKKHNPDQYVEVDEKYLAKLPEPTSGSGAPKQPDKDKPTAETVGGALSSQLGHNNSSVLTIGLDDNVTFSYDLHRMREAGAWQDGFLKLTYTHFQHDQGPGRPQPRGELLKGLQDWYWAYGGELDYNKLDLEPRGPAPEKWMTFEGRYTHGDRIILDYTINGRPILETPSAERSSNFVALHHTLRIGPGDEKLTLVVGEVDGLARSRSGVMPLDSTEPTAPAADDATKQVAVARTWQLEAEHPVKDKNKPDKKTPQGTDPSKANAFVAARVLGDTEGLGLAVDDKGRIRLTIPASDQARVIRVVRHASEKAADLDNFHGYTKHVEATESVQDPKTLTEDAPNIFEETVTLEGEVSKKDQPYVVDTIPVPVRDNPYGSWVRTSCVGFFDDGRAAVGTWTGDVWIVSGLDQSLDEVTWRRFAAGM